MIRLRKEKRAALQRSDLPEAQRIEDRLQLRRQRALAAWRIIRGLLLGVVMPAARMPRLLRRSAAGVAGALGFNPERVEYSFNHSFNQSIIHSVMGKSWKTTSAGILAIAGGVTRMVLSVMHHAVTEEAVMTSLTAVMTGIGLIFARDNDVTSEQAGAK